MMWFIDDNGCHDGALSITTLCRAFADLQRGYYDLGILGAAQVDRHGNINSTTIGNYHHPQVRLPGSGGGNDIGSSSGRLVIMTKLERKRFVSKLDYLTTPGYLEGGGLRKEAGLVGGGPVAVITDKCIFRFNERAKELVLDSLYPGVTVADVKRELSWEVKLSHRVKMTEPPSKEEVKLIRSLDSSGFVLGETLGDIDFDTWASSVEDMTRTLLQLYQSKG
jgi:glutaconate CoA-transferase subunit B